MKNNVDDVNVVRLKNINDLLCVLVSFELSKVALAEELEEDDGTSDIVS